jgi:hypothetical protein
MDLDEMFLGLKRMSPFLDFPLQDQYFPPFSKGEVFHLPLVSDPERSLTRRAMGDRGGFYEAFFKGLKCYDLSEN